MPEPTGRLELTWTHKHLRRLAHEDGSYEWVEPSDHRVAEVRLLREAATVGAVGRGAQRAQDNLLIRGDALHALQGLARLPEFTGALAAKVRLVYIDPPFNTQQSFLQYDDALEHSVWLTMMRDRLLQAKRLLAQDGSIWVHLDDSEVAYCRVLMDELFGRDNFVATIIWQKTYTRENRTDMSTSHEYVLVFSANRPMWRARRNLLPPSNEQIARYSNPDDDPRGPWKATPVHAKAEKGRRAAQFLRLSRPRDDLLHHRQVVAGCISAIVSKSCAPTAASGLVGTKRPCPP
ncbi:MAG: DNA methyltransferase [Longimicrobiales bacterium]|nr:DNA methyltransferase [Longimicrobiales bacterium]